MTEEHSQLTERLRSLREFLKTDTFKTLPEAERIRIQVQEVLMNSLEIVISQRISVY